MRLSKFKIYHIVLVVLYILSLVCLKIEFNLINLLFNGVLIFSFIIKIIYDFVNRNKQFIE